MSKQAIIAAALINAANELGLSVNMLVTSGNDGLHMRESAHYRNEALDFRTKHLTTAQKHELVAILRRRLGAHYDVILESEGLENEHGHAEHDPK